MTGIHIYAPCGKYVGQIRRRGHRKWEHVSESNTASDAMISAIKEMGESHNRARVLFCADWHDPAIAMELCK